MLSLSLSLSLFFSPPSLKLRRAMYPERDLNPHKHYCSQDFKSCVSTIPPSGLKYCHASLAGLASRAVVQSCSRWCSILHSKNLVLRAGPCPAPAGIPPSGLNIVMQVLQVLPVVQLCRSCKSCRSCRSCQSCFRFAELRHCVP